MHGRICFEEEHEPPGVAAGTRCLDIRPGNRVHPHRLVVDPHGDRLGRIGRDGPAVEGLACPQLGVRRRAVEKNDARLLGRSRPNTVRDRLIAGQQATEKGHWTIRLRRPDQYTRARPDWKETGMRSNGATPRKAV
jgi:hypothetical protein